MPASQASASHTATRTPKGRETYDLAPLGSFQNQRICPARGLTQDGGTRPLVPAPAEGFQIEHFGSTTQQLNRPALFFLAQHLVDGRA